MSKSPAVSISSSLYRAVWRWHFYAGLLVLPFLLLLAITGGVYVFHDEIDAFVYRDWNTVAERAKPMLPASVLVRRASADMPGHVVRIKLPDAPNTAARVVSAADTGARFTGYVDPYTGEVLGVTTYGGIMETIRNIHSLERFGFLANCLIEIAAGWALILVASGFYLWWPRRQGRRGRRRGGVVTVRGPPRRRVFWRDLHAVTGLSAAVVIAFLAATGMPWSAVWGNQFYEVIVDAGLGRPAMPESAPAMTHAQHLGETSWTLNPMPVPSSEPMRAEPIGLDRAVAIFDRLGLHAGYRIALPQGPRGAYSASWEPSSVAGTRVVHLDQYTGEVLADVRFAEFGAGAQMVEWAISVHQGEEFGWVNQLVMFAACIAIVILSLSGVLMWWKRRPTGSGAIGAPPQPQDRRAVRVVAAFIAIGGVLFPLVGLSIVVAFGVDWGVQCVRRRIKRGHTAAA